MGGGAGYSSSTPPIPIKQEAAGGGGGLLLEKGGGGGYSSSTPPHPAIGAIWPKHPATRRPNNFGIPLPYKIWFWSLSVSLVRFRVYLP